MIRKLLSSAAQRQAIRRAEQYRALLRAEAKIGGEVFGPITPGGRREFFCLDEHTWVWHEEWFDPQTRQPRVVTTRYDVHPNGILKAQDGKNYQRVSQEEARRLRQAAEIYYQRVRAELYQLA